MKLPFNLNVAMALQLRVFLLVEARLLSRNDKIKRKSDMIRRRANEAVNEGALLKYDSALDLMEFNNAALESGVLANSFCNSKLFTINLMGLAFGGWARMYSLRSRSKSLGLFLTAFFDATECDLQVSERMQGIPDEPIITPQ